ncbi:MAG: DUF4430 domain-containing protein [Candidatus Bathyarchaeota archaeon]|nr:DUF4430 domain-containing protein [Candidatus Bathyarchaeota archaeon]
MNQDTYKWIAAALFCTTLIAGGATIYLNNQVATIRADYQETLGELDMLTIKVNIKIDYGNETVQWYNDTRVPVGANLLNATAITAELDITTSTFGAFVSGINGVGGDANTWWLWEYYEEGWMPGMVGAEQWVLHNGDTVAWTYTSFS